MYSARLRLDLLWTARPLCNITLEDVCVSAPHLVDLVHHSEWRDGNALQRDEVQDGGDTALPAALTGASQKLQLLILTELHPGRGSAMSKHDQGSLEAPKLVEFTIFLTFERSRLQTPQIVVFVCGNLTKKLVLWL